MPDRRTGAPATDTSCGARNVVIDTRGPAVAGNVWRRNASDGPTTDPGMCASGAAGFGSGAPAALPPVRDTGAVPAETNACEAGATAAVDEFGAVRAGAARPGAFWATIRRTACPGLATADISGAAIVGAAIVGAAIVRVAIVRVAIVGVMATGTALARAVESLVVGVSLAGVLPIAAIPLGADDPAEPESIWRGERCQAHGAVERLWRRGATSRAAGRPVCCRAELRRSGPAISCPSIPPRWTSGSPVPTVSRRRPPTRPDGIDTGAGSRTTLGAPGEGAIGSEAGSPIRVAAGSGSAAPDEIIGGGVEDDAGECDATGPGAAAGISGGAEDVGSAEPDVEAVAVVPARRIMGEANSADWLATVVRFVAAARRTSVSAWRTGSVMPPRTRSAAVVVAGRAGRTAPTMRRSGRSPGSGRGAVARPDCCLPPMCRPAAATWWSRAARAGDAAVPAVATTPWPVVGTPPCRPRRWAIVDTAWSRRRDSVDTAAA